MQDCTTFMVMGHCFSIEINWETNGHFHKPDLMSIFSVKYSVKTLQKREVVKECLNLLKVLAGNDNVKRDIAASNGIETIINAISKHVVCLYLKTKILNF